MSTTDPEAVRIKLDDPIEKLGITGTVVEIDLLGDGVTGFYTRLIAFHYGSREEDIITAAEMLRLALAGLRESISSRKSRDDTDHWLWQLRWLDTIEDILSRRSAEAGIREARSGILHALRDNVPFDSPHWRIIVQTLEQAHTASIELAEEIDQQHQRRRAEYEHQLSFRELSPDEPGRFTNREALTAGLGLATRAGLDPATLQVGVAGHDAACIIRGRLL